MQVPGGSSSDSRLKCEKLCLVIQMLDGALISYRLSVWDIA
jgi:hypothetical protein